MQVTPVVEFRPKLADVTSAQWQALAGKRLFFGHQSVGDNLLDGVSELLRSNTEFGIRVVESEDPSRMGAPALYHARVGRNVDPQSKLNAFANIARAGLAEGGTAMLKFCYVDVDRETDPAALFEAYRRQVGALASENPKLTIVHFTLPLQADYGSFHHWRAVIRGQVTPYRLLNHIRERYNALLRAEYQGREPIFDLARLQSIRPDGSNAGVSYRGGNVPVLATEWTNDGGHLNEEGRLQLAKQFLITLATL